MASEVALTIWQRGLRDTPMRTALAIVKTILGASKPPAMTSPSDPLQKMSYVGTLANLAGSS